MYTYMRSYTTDEIAHLTGIPSNKVMEVCNLLSMEGYLIFDKETGKYRLTRDRDFLKDVKKLWKQCKDDHAFEQMSGKIEDIIEFGKPLALSEKGPGAVVDDIGVPGLNIIFGKMESKTKPGKIGGEDKRIPGFPRGHCLLIKGAPGTGKTTLGMQIALYLKKYRARFLTFEEDVNQLIRDLHGYIQDENKNNNSAGGWKKSDIKEVTRSLIKIRSPRAWENPDFVMEELISLFDRELPHLVVIDSISRFRDFGGDEKARQILRRLIRNLKCRRITSIFTAEERGEENPFEDYEVDGIINLQWAGDLLTLTVKKLRGMRAYKGPHSAALITVEELVFPQHKLVSKDEIKKGGTYLTAGFNVFPDISVFKDIPAKNSSSKNKNDNSIKDTSKTQVSKQESISTGTSGLDDLLPLPGDVKGFKKGETILLIGSAGSGKTLLALNFMLDGFGRKTPPAEKKEKESLVWLNLEGDIDTLRFATGGFKEAYKKDIEDMLAKNVNPVTGSRFIFIDFPLINLDLNKIVYTLEAMHCEYGIDRLVIDSITELERAKGGGQPVVKVFLAGLIQFLRERKITTVFVCRSDAFFRSIDKIEEQVSSLVDLIICIRNFDIHNQIHKGIYIQKARGRRHDSRILRMVIDSEREIDIEDSGWDLENLLAGDTSNIESPRVFFKLFYENPAEEFIDDKIIKDFDIIRYPGDDPKFTLVKKPSIYTEFWSFKGQFSAGHANTRVLSIPDYVISAFRDNERLAGLDKYIKSELLQKITSEGHLKKLYLLREEEQRKVEKGEKTEKNHKQEKKEDESKRYIGIKQLFIDAIPCYRDYGVMLFKEPVKEKKSNNENESKEDPLEKFIELLESNTNNIGSDNDSMWVENGYKWEKLLPMIKNINEKRESDKEMNVSQDQESVPFAFPPLEHKSEFVAFFMELLWSHGGDVHEIDIGEEYKEVGYGKKFKDKIKYAVFKEFKEHYNEKFKVKFKVLTESLETNYELSENKKPQHIEDIEDKFVIYGLDLKEIELKNFKEWVAGTLKGLNESGHLKIKSVLRLNDEPFKETIKLMLRLVHWARVTNPIEGEFRDRAILSRNWYSRISHLHKRKYNLLPLPLTKIQLSKNYKYYRSVTCVTYWSLAMLINALSPEIGGNFIESMNAPDYYEERLKRKEGMPVMNLEITKKRFNEFDPESYSILGRIMDNGRENEETLKKIGEYFKKREKEKGKEQLSEDDVYKLKSDIFKKENAFIRREFVEIFKEEEKQNRYVDQLENKQLINNRVFYPKLRHSRVAFYQLEQALHFQLRQLFIEDPYAREKRIYIYKDNDEVKYFDIYNETQKACEEDQYDTDPDSDKPIIKESDRWKDCLDKIEHEFRMHVIFELLSYFYHEHLTGGEAK